MQPRDSGQQRGWSLRQLWSRLTDPPAYSQKPERRQARLLSGALIIMIAIGLPANLLFTPPMPLSENPVLLVSLVVVALLIVAYFINRQGYYKRAVQLTLITLSFGIYFHILSGKNLANVSSTFYLIVPVLLASKLISVRTAFALMIFHLVGILLIPVLDSEFTYSILISPLVFNILVPALIVLTTYFRDLLEKDRQAWLNAVLRELPAGITVQAPNGELIYANDRAAKLVGYRSAEEFIKSPVTDVMKRFKVFDESGQPLDVTKMPGRLALQGIAGQEIVVRFTVLGTTQERWSMVRATPIYGEAGQVEAAINIFQDITKLKDNENTQRFMAQASAIMSTSLDYETTLKNVATLAVPTIADWVGIDILEDGEVKRLIVVHSDPAKLEMAEELARRYPAPGDAPRGVSHVLRSGESELYEDIPDAMLVASAQNDEHLRLIREVGLKSGMVVPLIARGTILGAFSFVTAESGRHYNADDLKLVQELAHRAALAIDNAQLYRNAQLERERFEVTLSSIGDAVIATNIHSEITFINTVAEQLTGWQRLNAVNRRLTDVFKIINEFTRETVDDPTRRVIEEGIVVGLANHTILIARDGTERPIDDSGAPIKDSVGNLHGAVLVFRDITEQKRAESRQVFLSQMTTALSSSLDYEETIQTIARLTVPVLADWCSINMLADNGVDLKHLVVAHSDPAKEELVQQILVHTAFTIDSNYPGARALRTGQVELVQGISEEFFQLLGADQFTRAALNNLKISVSVHIPLMARGHKLGILTLNMAESGRQFTSEDVPFIEDVGRRAAMAIDNARLYKEIHEAVRFRDEFLSIAAHELRTPVTSLQGFAQLLLKRFERTEALDIDSVQRAMKVINEQTHKLTRLIAQLLDISRIQLGTLSLDKQVTDLSDLVRSVAAAAQMGTASHTINVSAVPGISALIDGIRMEQVLWNLLDNAIKYSPDGGAIEVEVTTPTPDKVAIAVTDHGLGIPLEHKERIFERSYQAHPDRRLGGLGLGLYISRQIVEQHGGKITHEPVPGGGTRFVAILPR